MGNDLDKTIKQNYEKEKQEAIGAGVRALDSLRAASRYLENASNWGLLDMIGGGLFTTMIKHSKLDDAAQAMETARYDLQNFSKELADIDRRFNLSLSLGDFLELADYLLDNFFVDYMVQEKITDARRQVETAIIEIERILCELKAE